MKVILLGCPGAGKGTQSKFIAEKYQIPQISTGDILRNAIQKNTEIGKQIKEIVEGGHLVPDEFIIRLVQERIKKQDCKNGFLLDGFPRTTKQAEALSQLTSIDYVIDIEVPENEIIKRLSGRRVHMASGRTYHLSYNPPKIPNKDDITGEPLIQRPDDHEETIHHRLQVYTEQTRPLRKYYSSPIPSSSARMADSHAKNLSPHYVKIDGTRSMEEIKNDIFNLLDGKNKDVL